MIALTLRATVRRLALASAVLVALVGAGQPALADTSTETGVSVELVNEGALSIAWGDDSPAFTVNGEAPVINAANPTVIASATFNLAITDTRADAARTGYVVTLGANSFTADGAATSISTANLMILDITGLPEGSSAATAIGQPLDASVTILTVPNDAPAITASIQLTIGMRIEPETRSGTYSGDLTFDVSPLVSP